MYNHLRRCLIVSMKIHWELLTQKSSHEGILSPKIDCCTRRIWNTMCKRFYCQIVMDERAIAMQSDAQRKLDELFSDPENKKRYQILELEVDVLRHKAKKVPQELKPSDWWMLLQLSSKRQRK